MNSSYPGRLADLQPATLWTKSETKEQPLYLSLATFERPKSSVPTSQPFVPFLQEKHSAACHTRTISK